MYFTFKQSVYQFYNNSKAIFFLISLVEQSLVVSDPCYS